MRASPCRGRSGFRFSTNTTFSHHSNNILWDNRVLPMVRTARMATIEKLEAGGGADGDFAFFRFVLES
jgi:hypothetical protein